MDQLYHERREIENGLAELKNRLRGASFILRSKTPELVCQEIYASPSIKPCAHSRLTPPNKAR
ncbi:hypothetical protein [Streptomyces carpinensis]|uniref:Transposase n=1 Tax=Streptomyces carpinensis TaxID=66369 RepID=A0ABV1VU92_9ACTN|nr:hypothetical protein [Streptomyces carpinensis]